MGNETGDAIEAQARKEGMLTMSEDGIFKAAQGQTTIEEVLRVITE
jgi:type II secretory ATPase GspE/PulE/Tfp pilus assembly ATPase PilB-like protein